MSKLRLSIAVSHCDHVQDLVGGQVRADGIDLVAMTLPVEEIFHRAINHHPWDISEMSMGKFVSLVSNGDDTFVGLPVFPSRIFRHSAIYVRADGPVQRPSDLHGARVAVPEWLQTAGIYARGALTDDHGVDLAKIEWVQAGLYQPGRREESEFELPAGVPYRSMPDTSIDELFRLGRIDAAISARPPPAFEAGDPAIVRMFDNVSDMEDEYWRRTGIFPIMHLVVLRRELLEGNPWVARNLFDAFDRARERGVARALDATVSRYPIPWHPEHARAAVERFGDTYWPYGVEPNLTTLQAFLRYAVGQGVCRPSVRIDHLFPPRLRERHRV